MRTAADLKIKLFADGADRRQILELRSHSLVRGFTTNPTLMRAAGVTDYEAFAHEILRTITDRPLSLEVFADDFPEMERQARKIADWADNAYVKIPVTNTRGEPSLDLICRLAHSGVKVNVTAVLTVDQIRDAVAAVGGGAPAFVSVFAGRIADTGRDPVQVLAEAVELASPHPNVELIWASSRELLNILQANDAGCHVITLSYNMFSKLHLLGKDLDEYSLETVGMFYNDAVQSGYRL
ncbi:MAG: transaldolase [Bryobacteraceae bacterium]